MNEEIMRIAEDDNFRSNCIKRLVQEPTHQKKQTFSKSIPKLMIQFWDNLNEVPNDVQECLNSWNSFAQNNIKRFIFDDKKAKEFILNYYPTKYIEAYKNCHHPAMRCDYFRLCFINKFGGFYIDADEVYQGGAIEHLFCDNKLKMQPLCYDISNDKMIQPPVFINETEDSNNWIFYVNNNPIISPPAHSIISLALNRSTNILLNTKVKFPEIQSTTGPGNLSACLVMHWLLRRETKQDRDFYFITDWESISISKWPLSYRNDKRNWRIWNKMLMERGVKFE